ncbi:hypothetical protein [Algoriphagus sediminis]|uniref:Uncharacterized protein n=1 Tax=Algoriphagus sediminis TaxID=3057113 RepID=A0ABT7YDA5_9BACT|nr:hypothetical protein [Algoriphagus sediminis]MDN3204516.1 hypothetical protein [Algoriphagus sediminis]
MAIALDNLRVGRKYRFINMGESRKIEVMDRLSGDNFRVKDLDTLEFYTLHELLQWGKGKDYDLDELRGPK